MDSILAFGPSSLTERTPQHGAALRSAGSKLGRFSGFADDCSDPPLIRDRISPQTFGFGFLSGFGVAKQRAGDHLPGRPRICQTVLAIGMIIPP
jgi:hypothetical protein